jgi:membrane-associated HD superfamily phosphohydrolase
MLSSMLGDKEDVKNEDQKTGSEKPPAVPTEKPKSIFETMKEMISSKLKKAWKHMPWWIKKMIKFTPLGMIIKAMGLDKEEADNSPVEAKPTDVKPVLPTTPKAVIKKGPNDPSKDVPDVKLAPVNKPKERKIIGYKDVDTPGGKVLKKPIYAPEDGSQFAMRRDVASQKSVSNNSTVVSKDDKMLNKLSEVMKSNKPDEKVAQKAAQQMEQMRIDINKLIVKMGSVMDVLATSSKESKKQSGPVTSMGGLAGISEDAGDMRDPAYILRSRAWDRIRKGYVVI